MAAPTRLQFVDPSVSFPAIDPSNQIRLLLISSGRESSVSCRFNVVSIHDPPLYEALSYVWGTADAPHTITVDGHAFGVTQNLYAALQVLNVPSGTVRVLWIDAICINQGVEQSDLSERSQQVRLMSRIFSTATNVIAYLGVPYLQVQEATEFLTIAAGGQQSNIDQFIQSAERDISLLWTNLIYLFDCPWWGRVWTVQEAIVARKVYFLFEGLIIDADMVRRGIYNIVTSKIRVPFELGQLDRASGESLSTTFTKMSMLSLSYTGTSLLDALGAFQNRSSGDPRDKVYSLTGLVHDTDHVVNIDYTISTEQLFQDFALAWIQKHQDLKVLSHLHDPARRVHGNMPSFAADWSYQPPMRTINALHNRILLQNEAFGASKSSKAIWHLASAGLVRANGFVFDSIEAVGVKHILEFGSSWATRLNTLQCIVDMAIARDEKRQEQTLAAVRHTLCMDCKQAAGVYSRLKGEEDKALLSAWWENALKPSAPSPAHRLAGNGSAIETTVWIASLDRSFVFTEGGRMGLAPDWCKPGDAIAVMGGGIVPIVLRPAGEGANQGGDNPVFEVVGEAYVHDVMDGQAFDANGRTDWNFDDIYLV